MDIGDRVRFRDPLPDDLATIAGPDHAILLPLLAAAIAGEVGTVVELDAATAGVEWRLYGGGYVGPGLPLAVLEPAP